MMAFVELTLISHDMDMACREMHEHQAIIAAHQFSYHPISTFVNWSISNRSHTLLNQAVTRYNQLAPEFMARAILYHPPRNSYYTVSTATELICIHKLMLINSLDVFLVSSKPDLDNFEFAILRATFQNVFRIPLVRNMLYVTSRDYTAPISTFTVSARLATDQECAAVNFPY